MRLLVYNIFPISRLALEDTTDHAGRPLVDKDNPNNVDMTEEEIRCEFYCDFEAYRYRGTHDGGTFAGELRLAESEGRIGCVPHDSAYKVNTYWDVGIVDYTAIWFVQERQNGVYVIDFYMNRGKDLKFYLQRLRKLPYSY